MPTPMQPYAIGDRVVYLDPDRAPGDPGMVMAGEVTDVDSDGVTVLYDHYRHLPEGSSARAVRFAAAQLDRALASEEQYRANPAIRPSRSSWVREA